MAKSQKSSSPVITVVAQPKLSKPETQRALWWALLSSFDGKPVADYIAAQGPGITYKRGSKREIKGLSNANWLRHYTKKVPCVVVK